MLKFKSYLGLKFKKRATLIVPSLWLGTIFMIAINFLKHYEDPIAGYAILSFFTGLFIGGCYNNISSAIAVELSNREELKSIAIYINIKSIEMLLQLLCQLLWVMGLLM